MALSTSFSDPLFLGYVFVFAAAAIGCFASLAKVDAVEDTDTRWGLYTLLLTSGAWATTHVGYLLVPTPSFQYGFYLAGLIVGFAAVGPWLYFCSAYTGRSLHRDATLRRIALGVYLAVVAVKLTNPWHGQYFTSEIATVPFPHLAVFHQPIHWLVMALAYSLAVVGFFMLYELFFQVGGDTKPLAVLVALTGLPVVLDVLGAVSPVVLQFTYSPIGVAAFAIGVLFVFLDRFQRVQLAGATDDPVVMLDDDGEVWDYNRPALRLFPSLDGAIGERLEAVDPRFADFVANEEELIEVDRGGDARYYQLSANPFTTGHARIGRAITLTDVTHRERYRQELERQNERLEEFAGMISHDLRNPLNVATGRIELAREEQESEHLEAARNALDRMEALIEDVLALARQGQPIDEPEAVELSSIARRSWDMVESDGAELRIESDRRVRADPDRLQQQFENLFRNSIEHGGTDVTVTVGDLSDGFYVEDDGPGIPEEERERVFESGVTTESDGTGFGLAIVKGIADAHGWTVGITDGDSGGARFEFRNVTLLDN
ncbi:histidine kinase [Halalkaliarchaeum desulfuricum]|uniref:histidine kinase n=1 Tax=Halalkaliarchaeum desulfuricum TaxID=2055893 RepID=A0A343TIF0_9EURY|nr:ATP-binding protein [Halalkaliarchaeum desulfuricum]AUX08872.1 histidine kinase [Halalkaliarchaeum desulfuricum]